MLMVRAKSERHDNHSEIEISENDAHIDRDSPTQKFSVPFGHTLEIYGPFFCFHVPDWNFKYYFGDAQIKIIRWCWNVDGFELIKGLRMVARALWRSEARRVEPWSETLHEP